MHVLKLAAYACTIAFISGCSAVGVPYSSSPLHKLAYAESLLEQNRPTAAERLIVEALASCEKSVDPSCFAAAYRGYGRFFADPSLSGPWRSHYADYGFIETTANLDNRYEKAIEYLDKSRNLYSLQSRYDALSNVYLQMGFIYAGTDNRDSACAAFDASLQAQIDNRHKNPNVEVNLPKRYGSFEDYIAEQKAQAQCTAPGL